MGAIIFVAPRTHGKANPTLERLNFKPPSLLMRKRTYLKAISLCLTFLSAVQGNGYSQSVTGIITDFNGFWNSRSNNINPTKPNNSHNLLAFTYNGVQYSTGVNDELLSSQGQDFVPGDFWSLPYAGISGSLNGNTKVGLGSHKDGVAYGSSNPAPNNDIASYLSDGIKGLDIGTCIANLPSGTMNFFSFNIQPSKIGDGIPDILVTQVAEINGGSYDRYEFTDENGARVGNSLNIVFTSISPVGNWMADFYQANANPLTLQNNFTHTERPLRLWAADLSEFGITAQNYTQVHQFRINLCGSSDVAFVAYNNQSVNFQGTLPLNYHSIKGRALEAGNQLTWSAESDVEGVEFEIERSNGRNTFTKIGSISSHKPNGSYSFLDKNPLPEQSIYRIRYRDLSGRSYLSTSIRIQAINARVKLEFFPNPVRDRISVVHPLSKQGRIIINDISGREVMSRSAESNSSQTSLAISLRPGTYFITYANGSEKHCGTFIVK